MSDMKMYNILGHFNNLDPQMKPVDESVKSEPVYESVEARGSIMEAIRTLEEQYSNFKEGREHKDKDSFDKYAKPGDTYKTATGTVTKTAQGVKHERGAGKEEADDLDEGMYDEPAAPNKEAILKRKHMQALKDKQEDERAGRASAPSSHVRKIAGKAYGGAAQKDAPEADDLDEEYSSTGGEITKKGNVTTHKAKKYGGEQDNSRDSYGSFDRLNKRSGSKIPDVIDSDDDDLDEAGYSAKKARAGKDIGKPGKNFSKIAKGAAERYGSKAAGERVAGAVLNKLRHGEEMDEVITKKTSAGDIINDFEKSKNPKFAGKSKEQRKQQALGAYYGMHPEKSKVSEGKEAIRHHPIYTDKDAWDHYKQELDEQEMMDSQHMAPVMDEAPMEPTGMHHELDEIARLAGLQTEERLCSMCETAPCSCSHEEMEMEGNEFSGALAKAKASGAKEFEVGGKRYAIKENVSLNVVADQAEEAVALLRKLSGLDPLESNGLTAIDPNQDLTAGQELVQAEPEYEEIPQADGEEEEVEVAEDAPNVKNSTPRKGAVLNTPREEYAAADITTKGGTGHDRNKKTYRGEWPGDNPMDAYGRDGTQVKEDTLWKSYERMIKDIKS